ncbi:MAG: MarR family winged helix-turn-helix transcriptional regulator [Aristaeellaceae bacterium]
MTSHVMQEMQRFNNLLGEIDGAYHEASQKLGLTDSAMQVLYVLCNDGGESLLSRICRMSGTSKQTINSALRNLEKGDYIRLEALPGRRKKVCLTQRGETLAAGTAQRLIAMENAVFGAWSKQDRETYLTLTRRYLAAFREQVKELSDRA